MLMTVWLSLSGSLLMMLPTSTFFPAYHIRSSASCVASDIIEPGRAYALLPIFPTFTIAVLQVYSSILPLHATTVALARLALWCFKSTAHGSKDAARTAADRGTEVHRGLARSGR